MRAPLKQQKYRLLLLSLLVLVLLFPLHTTPAGHIITRLLFSLVFAAALLVVFPSHRLRVVAGLLGVPTLIGLWTGYLLPGLPRTALAVGFHSLAALFFGYTIGVILWSLHREKEVTADSVYGAFSGYILTGVAFGHLFNVVAVLSPGSFRGDEFAGEMSDDRRHFLLTYFSFVTLTTVGYGDISPAGDGARGLSMVEAIVGQFYIAVLVAELIGKRVSTAVPDRDAAPASGAPLEVSAEPTPPTGPAR